MFPARLAALGLASRALGRPSEGCAVGGLRLRLRGQACRRLALRPVTSTLGGSDGLVGCLVCGTIGLTFSMVTFMIVTDLRAS